MISCVVTDIKAHKGETAPEVTAMVTPALSELKVTFW